MNCDWCHEEILTGQECRAIKGDHHFHHECSFRQIGGSVGHIRRKCSCYGGNEDDPPGMTIREAARASLAEWHKWNPMSLEEGAILKKGDKVSIRVQDNKWLTATVSLASNNAASLALLLPEPIFIRPKRGGVLMVQVMLVLHDGGAYSDVLTGVPVELKAVCDEQEEEKS